MYQITIIFKDSKSTPVQCYMDKDESRKFLDQCYEVFSDELEDRTIELSAKDEEGLFETMLLRSSEILYVKSRKVSDE